ncbi:2'-deoxycytidine 5'-triphosphate deaminase [Balneolaceae bacterium YR4-1]|uniref:2'-deoxycytidine 5'-triphosphate deaminase n=1 Tax=Halalkalibaculum roseum TaxID=2709311 RepID=A0A6M1SNJ4_9BACT|nr:2'-deoxycytidine 5'-triphosphate deaminase [Halalkalibaculum roseum]NGP76941.1 2'-deoxycytidine 5'-triphosphate deaminase [Halalkalibaculum roseum]
MNKKSKEVYLRTKGILPVQKLHILADAGIISAQDDYPLEENQFQPNSIDLRLGKKAYRVRSSFLPEDESVKQKVDKLRQYEFSIEDGAVLETNCVYIIPLLEELNLPSHISPQKALFNGDTGYDDIRIISEEHLTAKANPKSTTGRLDIFTRVITDYSHRFEEIRSGYKGRLYLEVVPKSFPIKVRTGQRLNQLRIRHGHTVLSDQDILRMHGSDPLLFTGGGKILELDNLKVNNGLFLSVNLHAEEGTIVGYKAKKHRDLIDLENVNHYEVSDFWEPIHSKPDDHLILEPEAFYIFASKERCRIPEHLAAEMIAYDTGSGELRTHYAGFFDSGFGGRVEDRGARAVLEVRSHDVPFLIEDGQTFCSMQFEPNTEVPEFVYGSDIKSNYQGQGLKLGKHFKQD